MSEKHTPVASRWRYALLATGMLGTALACADPMQAGEGHLSHQGMDAGGSPHARVTPPASLMGTVMIPKGEFMVNFLPMWMHMDGLRMGTSDVSPEEVVTTVPNRFAGMPMPGDPMMKQPAFLRTTPLDMDMSAQMLGVMYGLTDRINLMVMATYVEKEMNMVVFKGATGTQRLGTSNVSVQGFGDTSASVLVRLYEDKRQEAHLTLGLSLPTGSTTEDGSMLMPANTTMNMRLAYGMQLGDGTYDFLPGLTYTGRAGAITWGLVYRGRFPLETNDVGWRVGSLNQITGWGGYDFTHILTGTLRIAGQTQGSIHGMDPQITGPSPGSNPDFYGGDTIDALVGLSGKVAIPGIGKGRIAAEVGLPLYQDLNGVQAAPAWSLTLSLMVHF